MNAERRTQNAEYCSHCPVEPMRREVRVGSHRFHPKFFVIEPQLNP